MGLDTIRIEESYGISLSTTIETIYIRDYDSRLY